MSQAPADCALRIVNLSLAYGGKPALEDVSLDIPARGVTAIIGPSGCGKSSFLMALNRMTDLVPGCTVRGSIALHGREILAPDVDTRALRQRIGFIAQKPIPFPLSIRRNLTLPLKEHGMRARAQRDATVERVLREVGLWDEVAARLDAPALQLSGGQQQRLCIARALALEPELILLDEPCSALDPLSSGIVEDLVAALGERYAVVVVTHNLAQARRIAQHAAFFWYRDGAGVLVESGPAETLFRNPRDPLTRDYIDGMRG